MLPGHASSSGRKQPLPEYSTCAKREEAPLILRAPSNAPAARQKPTSVLSSATSKPGSVDGPRQALLTSDTSDNDSGQNVERANGHDDDDDDDDNAGFYRPASEVVNSASGSGQSYMIAQSLLDADAVDSLPPADTTSTSDEYWRAELRDPPADAGPLDSTGTDVDRSLDGDSGDESTTGADADDSQSPDSNSRYCAAEFFTNL